MITWVLDEEATHEQKAVVGLSASLSLSLVATKKLTACFYSAAAQRESWVHLETKFSLSHKSINSYGRETD